MSDWKGFCLAAFVFIVGATFARAQDHQEKVKVVIIVADAGGGKWSFTTVQSVNGDALLGAMVAGALKSASFPHDWRTRGDFKMAIGDRWAWLADRLEKRGVKSPLCTFHRDADGNYVLTVVGSVGAGSEKKGIHLVITSWAVTTAEKLSLDGADGRIRARLAAETASHTADDPASFTQLWQNSTITLEAKPNAPATGQSAGAIKSLREESLELLAAICSAYSDDQRRGVGYEKINAAMAAPLDQLLGSKDDRSVPAEMPGGEFLQVTIADVDPIMGADVAIPAIELPGNLGGVMMMEDFQKKYGGQKFGQRLLAERDQLSVVLKRELEKAGAEPESFPRFMEDEKRRELGAVLGRNPLVSTVGFERAPASGRLVYSVTFRPEQSHLNLTAKGDSVRELSGRMGWDKTWAGGEGVSLAASVGTDSASASASYSRPDRRLGDAIDFKLRYDGSYVRESAVRLGNQSGPLVRREETLLGPRAQIDVVKVAKPNNFSAGPSRQSRWDYSASLFAGFRNLTGGGSTDLLGASPNRLKGAELTHLQSIQFENAPVTSANGSSASNPLRALKFAAGATLEITEFVPDSTGAYLKARLDLFARQEFGAAGHTDYYVEGRWSGGAMSHAASRLDFWRLGGQDVVSGLDAGELAGRTMWSAAIEGGWNLAAIGSRFDRLKPGARNTTSSDAGVAEKNPLDGLYLIGLADCGHVGSQDDAGQLFSSHSSVSSLGTGIRLFGVLSGPSKDSSLTLGYAWSPESIRKSGRVFVRVIIHL
ncbi:MAG TPA: hypothetical protein VGM64_13915 [Lacunisphaera sp.]|jgi:hypothetical protein